MNRSESNTTNFIFDGENASHGPKRAAKEQLPEDERIEKREHLNLPGFKTISHQYLPNGNRRRHVYEPPPNEVGEMTHAEFTAWKKKEKAKRKSPAYRESRQNKAAMIRDMKQQLLRDMGEPSRRLLQHFALPVDADVLMDGASAEPDVSSDQAECEARINRLAADEDIGSSMQAEVFVLPYGKEKFSGATDFDDIGKPLNQDVSPVASLTLDEYW